MQLRHDSQKKVKLIFSLSGLILFSSLLLCFLLYFHGNLIMSCFKLDDLAQVIQCATQITARERLCSFPFCKSFTIIFRYQVEKQILGEINGNPASWNLECDSSKVSYCLFSFFFQSLLQSNLCCLVNGLGEVYADITGIVLVIASAWFKSLLSAQVGILKHF